MKYPANPFTQALKAQDKQLGLWVSMGSLIGAEIAKSAGFDWVVIDMEHSPNTYQTVLPQLQIFESSPTVPLVRVETNDAVQVKKLLDMGAPGLIFPMIETLDEAKAALAATRYPPRGIRGMGGTTVATAFGRYSDYLERCEEELTVILQLETLDAMEQAEEIAALDGVSGIFFGPGDISADMGLLGQPLHPDVWAKINPIAQRLADQGKAVGTLVTNLDFAADLLKGPYSFVAVGIDTGILARGMDHILTTLKG